MTTKFNRKPHLFNTTRGRCGRVFFCYVHQLFFLRSFSKKKGCFSLQGVVDVGEQRCSELGRQLRTYNNNCVEPLISCLFLVLYSTLVKMQKSWVFLFIWPYSWTTWGISASSFSQFYGDTDQNGKLISCVLGTAILKKLKSQIFFCQKIRCDFSCS